MPRGWQEGTGAAERRDAATASCCSTRAGARSAPLGAAVADERFAWVADAVERGTTRQGSGRRAWSDRVDAVATPPVAPEAVRAAVDHLVRMGRLGADRLTVGSADGGCGACPSGVDGAPGCGAPGPSKAGGPVLVALSVRRPAAAHMDSRIRPVR